MISRIRRIHYYLEVIPKLGLLEVLYVIYYKIIMKTGIFRVKFPVIAFKYTYPVFKKCSRQEIFIDEWKESVISQANKIIDGFLPYYSFHWIKQSIPPNWFLNPFNGKECKQTIDHWTNISDFRAELGDIKNVWEASRFTWVGILARAYVVSGKEIYLNSMNEWISNWAVKNPVNQGPNWKCGQEASIRVINLLNAANILNQVDNPSDALILTINLHLQRISKNTRYGFAQRNNHATSEAAALFIGGNWLKSIDPANYNRYHFYAEKGRRSLEILIRKLVYDDGGFSQHSTNYHRMFIDTLSFVAFWTRKLNLHSFTPEFYKISEKAVDWLLSVMDESGKCPNLGANDGTMLQGNHSCDYRDFRPCLQIASALIKNQIVFETGPWDEPLFWMNIKRDNFPKIVFSKKNIFHNSSLVIMKGKDSWALLRFPYYKFRPSHNDVFHFDLWAKGRNLLFDSGSFSYYPEDNCVIPDLKSVHCHNTISFDKSEQMPRLGRFLLGKWIKSSSALDIVQLEGSSGIWEGAYIDSAGNCHKRIVNWENNKWQIHDTVSGKAKYIQIGFNFNTCEYLYEDSDNSLLLPWGKIIILGNAEVKIQKQYISNYYFQSLITNRLIINSDNNTEIITTINIF